MYSRWLFTLAACAAILCKAITTAQETGNVGLQLADSFITRGIEPDRYYDTAVLWRAMEYAYNQTGDEKYHDFIVSGIDTILSTDNETVNFFGSWNYSEHDLDDIRVGTILLDLYESEGDAKYKNVSDFLRDWIDQQARIPAGGFWHKDPKYPNQMWLDGLYMAEPFYAQYTALFEPDNTTAWDDILLQFSLMEQHDHWKKTGLLVHGWTTKPKSTLWAKPNGKAPHVWDRALGWYFMALVDVLDWYPEDHPGRSQLVGWFQDLAAAVVEYQDPDSGGWWLIIEPPYPGRPGNYIESSGTAMFTYGLLKGIRRGFLERSQYFAPAQTAYELMVDRFVADNGTNGTLNWEGTVEVGSLSGNGSYGYYVSVPTDENDFKGAGPFIFASIEYENLLSN